MTRFFLALVVLLGVWLAIATALFVVRHDDEPIHADALVVLQGSTTRLPLGYKLMQEGYAPLMVISRGSKTELEDKLCGGKTALKVVCFSATSTRGEARIVNRIARERGLRSIDVVTSRFHIFRARRIFERCYDGELTMVGSSQAAWKLPKQMVTETVKLAYQSVFARGC